MASDELQSLLQIFKGVWGSVFENPQLPSVSSGRERLVTSSGSSNQSWGVLRLTSATDSSHRRSLETVSGRYRRSIWENTGLLNADKGKLLAAGTVGEAELSCVVAASCDSSRECPSLFVVSVSQLVSNR